MGATTILVHTGYGMADKDGAIAAWEKAKAINPESRVGKAADEYLLQISKQAEQ